MPLDFTKFNTGTLFLVRTPEVFPVGYADKSFEDMKHNLHFDYAALLETWNCTDGVLWKSDKFPRSNYWKDEPRDPIEECFLAADKYDMAFLPEAGMMDEAFMLEHKDGRGTFFDGTTYRYGRVGLAPACPYTLDYLVEKYDALYEKFGHHKSFKGFCMPAENGASISYDKYTKEAWKKSFGYEMSSPEQMYADKALERKTFDFIAELFLTMYKKLARHLKQKYGLPLMHYPLAKLSSDSYFQPSSVYPQGNISLMDKVEDLDMLNLQLHPPLNPNPYCFKFETEFLMGNTNNMPCMADTHFYHEYGAGRLPDATPKRIADTILSTLTPWGISFFCYGFMAEELPLWKKELNIGAPVYSVYRESHTVDARREFAIKAMDYVEILRPLMQGTKHSADCAIYYPEHMNNEYMYGSYPVEHIFGLHEVFNAATIPVKMISSMPTCASEEKLIVLDSVKKISHEEEKALVSYIKDGGKVVVIGNCCKEIEDAAGVATALSDAEFISSPDSDDYNHCYIRIPSSGRHYTEANGTPVLLYNDGTPAITTRDNILYIGVSDAIGRFGQYRDYYLASWWKNYFTKENLNSGVEFHNVYVNTQDRHQFVSCDIFENTDKKLLFIRNFGVDQDVSSVNWDVGDDFKITKAWADGKKFVFEKSGKLPVFEHFAAIFAEKQKED